MDEYIYRYTSFEAFVDIIQNRALTFVLFSLWEDPMEGMAMFDLVSNTQDSFKRTLVTTAYFKTFAQCWSSLAESDAMWRIYSYNNRAVRIKIKRNNIALLDGVEVVDVNYSDDVFEMEEDYHQSLLKALSQKRTAFSHEKEVRLIKRYRFGDTKDAERHIKAFLAINNDPKSVEILEELYPKKPIEVQVEDLMSFLNLGEKQVETQKVSFDSIPNFIEGILVHPFAPDWYVKVVEDFCFRNNIPFEGKSLLYTKS